MGPSPEQAAAPHTAAAMAAAEGLNPDRGRRGGDPYEKPEAYHAREVNRRYHGRGDAARQARAQFYRQQGWDVDDVGDLSERQARRVRRARLFSDDLDLGRVERLLANARRRNAGEGRLSQDPAGIGHRPLASSGVDEARRSGARMSPEMSVGALLGGGSPTDPRVPQPASVEDAIMDALAAAYGPRKRRGPQRMY